jgi:putative PEP-CTERM system TPR-repeat lipoprotein
MAVMLAFVGCARSPQAKRDKHMAAGKALLEKKDAKRAVLEFKNAAQAVPRDSEVFYQLGLAYLAANDFGKGVASLRKALELNPKHAAAQLRLAQLMTNVDDPGILKDAQQRLQALLQDAPKNAEALHALALTELKLGDPKEAMRHLEQAVSEAPQELVLAATLAVAKLEQKDFKGAEEVLKKACETSPKSVDCAITLGRLYATEDKTSEAEQKFQQAVAMDPNNAAALLSLAALENTAGRKQEAEQNFKRLSSLPDKTFRAYHAIFLFQEGRRDEALKEFEVLARKDPEDRALRTLLAAAYQTMNRLPDARSLLTNALKKNPKDLDALLQRGEIFLSDGKYSEAEADFNEVLHLKSDAPEVHYAIARLCQVRGEVQRQRAELNEALRLNPFLIQARLELASSMIREHAAKSALEVLDAAPQSQKNLVAFIELRNWALLSLHELGEARKWVELGLASARTPAFLIQDAFINLADKRYPEARRLLHEVLGKAPEDLQALRLLVRTYADEKQMPAAIEQVRMHAAQNPKSAAVQFFLGRLLFETGNQVQAKQAFMAAKALNPDYTPAVLSLAEVDLTLANWDDARRGFTTVLSKKREDSSARSELGMLEFSVGNQNAAIIDFRKAIETQPNDAVALNNLAYLLAENGQADEALKYAQKAVELAPDKSSFLDTLGWVLYRKGVYNAALTHLQSAAFKSNDVRVQYHLAMAYFKSGGVERGRVVLQNALHRDSNLPEAKLAQELFQNGAQPAKR